MTATTLTTPRFREGQIVGFTGGSGTVIGRRPEAGSWLYLVEMELGPEPKMGRIGYETTIVLNQSELLLQESDRFSELALSA